MPATVRIGGAGEDITVDPFEFFTLERDGLTYGPILYDSFRPPLVATGLRARFIGGGWLAEDLGADGLWTPRSNFRSDCLFFSSVQEEAPLSQITFPEEDDFYAVNLGGLFQDTFNDTYQSICTVTIAGQTLTTTKTYNREGLCVWRSRNQNGDVDGSLYYRTLASAEEAERFGKGRILWSLSGAGFRTEGDGPYNSPAGRYGANGQCVVTEA